MLSVLFALDIIGNPIGLFSNIATGVFDMIDKPITGIVHGPIDALEGLSLGGASLIKNTISGTFNAVNKISGSLATGISALSVDDDYMRKRI